jgi:putative ABC transport system ATP-binding protein
MSACVDLRDVRFAWPGQAACIDLPALTLDKGERVFLHGPSGSGKSTLLGLLGGVLLPATGSVTVLGQSLGALSAPARDRFRADHLGIIFQQFNLISYLSVLDNVRLPCRFSARRARACVDEGEVNAATRLLAHLEIAPDLFDRPAAALSVGQQQRVAAARALIGGPELLIADEPTSALDSARQHAFLDLLASECAVNKTTLLFVSHDERLAARFDRVLDLRSINRSAQAQCVS